MGIKILVMDVDGTLTDGRIYMGDNGEICKAFNIKDGYGIHDLLIPTGVLPVIITGRTSKIVANRCKELGITEIHQGISNKTIKLMEITEHYGVALQEVSYIGDDLNDMSCMKMIKEAGGRIGCPADAVKEIRSFCDFVAEADGGNGAVREFIEHVLSLQIKE